MINNNSRLLSLHSLLTIICVAIKSCPSCHPVKKETGSGLVAFNSLWIALSVLCLCGCAATQYIPDRELIEDPQFAHWFNIRGLGGDVDDGKVQSVFPSSELISTPSWTIAQWGSRYNFSDPKVTEKKQLASDIFQLQNRSKRFTVDSRKGMVEMGLFASSCYDQPRLKGGYWPHLLISTPFTDVRNPSGACKVENIRKLNLNLNCQLLRFEDQHPHPDPDLHAAQFLLHIYVQNLTIGDDGYGDMIWFGIPIFDNRREISEEHYSQDSGKPDASGKFIFNMAHQALRPRETTFFKDGKIAAGENTQVISTKVDLIPWIHYAFQLARKNGFMQTTSFRDLHVSGMNLGWEMPGTYDGIMRVSDLSLIAEY